MKIYSISEDAYLQHGIMSFANTLNIEIIEHKLNAALINNLSFDDIVILHLDIKSNSCAWAISTLNKTCKLLVIMRSARNIVIDEADEVLKSRVSLNEFSQALQRIIKKQKNPTPKDNHLSDIEYIIINESLKGKNIDLIANTLNIPPKKVYAYRNKACKKLGGKKISDLLLIRESLLAESSAFFAPSATSIAMM